MSKKRRKAEPEKFIKFLDFILLVEWCQEKGPNIIKLFPEEYEELYLENLKFLSVFTNRIFSSDRDQIQMTSKSNIRDNTSGWNSFSDSSTYLTDSSVQYYSYIHRITLHDLKARGYVRPICVCYLTNDSQKIISNFQKFINTFNNFSKLLKFGNNSMFIKDIQMHLKHIYDNDMKELRREYHSVKKLFLEEDEGYHELKKNLEIMNQKYEKYKEKEVIRKDMFEIMKRFVFNEFNGRLYLNLELASLLENGLVENTENMDFKNEIKRVLSKIHKNTDFEKLRKIEDIVGKIFGQNLLLWERVYDHFKRSVIVLELESDDLDILQKTPLPSTLFVGKSLVMDFTLNNSVKKYITFSLGRELENSNPGDIFNLKSSHEDVMMKESLGTYIPTIFPGENLSHFVNGKKVTPKKKERNIFDFQKKRDEKENNMNLGKGILKLSKKYSFMKDLVYNILKGRVVVIYSNDSKRKEVEHLISVLSIFVPGDILFDRGQNKEQYRQKKVICKWKREGIGEYDLLHYKLIGLSKKIKIHINITYYITLLDYDKEILYGLEYDRGFLDPLFLKEKKWKSEESYLSYLHSFFLQIGMKSSLYFHLNFLDPHLPKRRKTLKEEEKGKKKKEVFSYFVSKKGVLDRESLLKQIDINSSCDLNVIEYFVTVVKDQQTRAYEKIVEKKKKLETMTGSNLTNLDFYSLNKIVKMYNKK